MCPMGKGRMGTGCPAALFRLFSGAWVISRPGSTPPPPPKFLLDRAMGRGGGSSYSSEGSQLDGPGLTEGRESPLNNLEQDTPHFCAGSLQGPPEARAAHGAILWIRIHELPASPAHSPRDRAEGQGGPTLPPSEHRPMGRDRTGQGARGGVLAPQDHSPGGAWVVSAPLGAAAFPHPRRLPEGSAGIYPPSCGLWGRFTV